MDWARSAMAGSSPFSFGASALTGIVRWRLRSRSVASMRIWSDLGVLPPNHRISAAEFRDAADHRGIDGTPRSNPQVREHLVQAVWRNGAQMRGLAYVGAEHVREAWAKPIERSIA